MHRTFLTYRTWSRHSDGLPTAAGSAGSITTIQTRTGRPRWDSASHACPLATSGLLLIQGAPR